VLVDTGVITAEQLALASRIHKKVEAARTLVGAHRAEGRDRGADSRRAPLGPRRRPLGDVLVELGRLEPHELHLAIAQQREHPQTPIEDILIDNHIVNAADVVAAQADLLNLTPVMADTVAFDVALLKRAPVSTYKAHGFVPVRREGERTLVVFADPANKQHLELARKHFGADLIVGIGARKSVMAAIGRAEKELVASVTVAPLLADGGGAVALVNGVLDQALANRVSDIHFEPGRERLRIRFRRTA
jgi:type IV pilus assembly protein PilB